MTQACNQTGACILNPPIAPRISDSSLYPKSWFPPWGEFPCGGLRCQCNPDPACHWLVASDVHNVIMVSKLLGYWAGRAENGCRCFQDFIPFIAIAELMTRHRQWGWWSHSRELWHYFQQWVWHESAQKQVMTALIFDALQFQQNRLINTA